MNIVKLCANCIKELEKQHPGLNKELEDAIRDRGQVLSHGSCFNHLIETLRGNVPNAKIQNLIQQRGNNKGTPDLRQHPEIIQQLLQSKQQAVAKSLKERLQKLANIVKEIKNASSCSN